MFIQLTEPKHRQEKHQQKRSGNTPDYRQHGKKSCLDNCAAFFGQDPNGFGARDYNEIWTWVDRYVVNNHNNIKNQTWEQWNKARQEAEQEAKNTGEVSMLW